MKQVWKVGAIALACQVMIGCRDDSQRLAQMAERTVQMQADQNTATANAQRDFVSLNSQLQTERINLNQQSQDLEQERRDLHRLRRSELAWAESFRFLAIVIAAVMPLFLCAYLIWGSCQQSDCQEDVNELLIRELVSSTPRLIAAPNLRSIEHETDDRRAN